jgi:hypothetical protein
VAFGAVLGITGAIASGCGGSSDNSSNPADSGGQDQTTDHVASDATDSPSPNDAVSDVCVPDADITKTPIPDADIGDTGLPVSGCVSCVEQNCQALIAQCNMSCQCVSAFEMFTQCFASGSNLFTCGQQFATNAGISAAQVACAIPCADPCGVQLPGDGGGGDSASTDATGQ